MRITLVVLSGVLVLTAAARAQAATAAEPAAAEPAQETAAAPGQTVETDSAAKEKAKMQNAHQYLSTQCFNDCWALIDKAERTPADTEIMVLLAGASAWHWLQRTDVTPENRSVAYWQLARVHALAGESEPARRYGERCLQVSLEGELAPFYLGYAHEALARAELVAGHGRAARDHLAEAREALAQVADPDERALLAADLDKLAAAG